MKEIGKLLELLNEYDPYIASDGEHRDNLWGYAYQGHSAVFPKELAESYIISARYGFIKWLVENDKIDIKKLVVKGEMRSGWDFENKKGDEEEGEEIWNKYWSELCLMLLSIQDEPIRFLCEIIK